MTSTATIFRVTEQDQTPGPDKYLIPSDIGQAQKFTIRNRFYDHQKRGPGYENIPTTIGEGKKWSLAGRPKDKDITPGPGPNYVPPGFGSDARSSSFHIRGSEKVRHDGPGPGRYDTSGMQSNNKGEGRHFTLKARKFINEERHDGPGPKYNPNYEPTLPSSRKSTIYDVIRRKDSNDIPGPGKYDIDRSPQLGQVSFHQRTGSVKLNDNPGPGRYEPEKYNGGRQSSPSYSLRSRIDIPDRSARAPYQKIPDEMGNNGPKYSLTSRRDVKAREVPPGPNYMPPPFGSDARKYSLASSRRDRRRDPSKEPPGPGQYDINGGRTNDGRKYSMKGRNFFPEEGKSSSPGPAYLPDYNNVLPSARKITIRDRVPDPKAKVGPGYYDIGTTIGQGPKITIGNKEKLNVRPGLG